MAYNQKFGKAKSNPLAYVADKLKEGSGLMMQGDLNKDGTLNEYEAKRQAAIDSNSNSAATMYGAPVHMKGGGSQIGHLSGINYGSPVHSEGHGAPEGHKHSSEGSDDYTYQKAVKPSGKNVSRKATRKQSKDLYNAAQQGYGSQAYSEGGSGTSVKIGKQPGNKRNIISVRRSKGGTTAGYGSEGPVYDEANKNVSRRDIKKQLRESGSVTVKGGKVTSGTTLTKTAKGSVKRDTHKANLKKKKENFATKKAAKNQSLITARANKKAEQETKRNEYRAKSAAKKAQILAARKAAKEARAKAQSKKS
tara:strand:- start:2467 stop:3387 length:921 start_codon:yes stop_codon:yes gene_type:complete